MRWWLIWVAVSSIAQCRPPQGPNESGATSSDVECLTSLGHSFPKWLPLAYLSPATNHLRSLYAIHDHPSNFQYYHFPRYYKNPESLNVEGLHPPKPRINSKFKEKLPSNTVLSTTNTQETSLKEVLEKISSSNEPVLAPYRFHPLLHYIKNRNTIQKDKIIAFRTVDNPPENEITTLILKPVSTASAGVEGKAIANPVSRAILREGSNADILFEPQAVAIAGPGGIAHAESDLEIIYEDFVK